MALSLEFIKLLGTSLEISSQYTKRCVGKKQNRGYVYVLQCGKYYKIGRTKNVKSRLAQIKTAS